MATLTTTWQSLKSATLSSGITIHLDGRYTSQDITNNNTKAEFRLRSVGTAWRTTSGTYKFTGAYTDNGSCATYPDFIESGDIIKTIKKTITHNQDGTKSISLGAEVKAVYNGATNTATLLKVTITMPTINRLATMTSANDFDDTQNPTIEFNNPSGFEVRPYINFYDNSNNLVYQLYRDISVTSPYTWEITDTERESIRQACNKQKTYKVNIGVDTYSGSTKLGNSSLGRTFSIINANPTMTYTFTELNSKVLEYISDGTLVSNISKVKISVNPTAYKNATIKSVGFAYGNEGEIIVTSPYEKTFDVKNDNKFTLRTYDSRTNYVVEDVIKNIIPYEPLSIGTLNSKRVNPTSSDLLLKTEIKYFQVDIGDIVNSFEIIWKIGESGEEHYLTDSDYTVDTENNKIIVDTTLRNAIDYRQRDNLIVTVTDLLSSSTNSVEIIKGIPTFDAGEHDLKVNGELYIANRTGQNKVDVGQEIIDLKSQNILWSGSYYMNELQSIDLTETPISSQSKGIILVFSAYSDGQAQDYDFVEYFVPKKIVELKSGNGHDIFLNTANFGYVGSKYLRISDTLIEGYNNNTSTGTGSSGIKYTNSHWVLRYVIGI